MLWQRSALGLGVLAVANTLAMPAFAAGLPQLNAEFFLSQLFWLLISFGLFYGLMAKFLLPKLERVVTDRTQRKQGDLAQAAAAHEKAKAIVAGYEKQLLAARSKAQAEVEGILQQAEQAAAKAQADQARDLQLQLNSAETAIAQSRAAALSQLDTLALEMAQLMVGKLGIQSPTAAAWQTLLTARQAA